MGDNDILHNLKAFETIIRGEKIKNVRINDFLWRSGEMFKIGRRTRQQGQIEPRVRLGNPRPILPQKRAKIKPKTQKITYVGNLQKCNKITEM